MVRRQYPCLLTDRRRPNRLDDSDKSYDEEGNDYILKIVGEHGALSIALVFDDDLRYIKQCGYGRTTKAMMEILNLISVN